MEEQTHEIKKKSHWGCLITFLVIVAIVLIIVAFTNNQNSENKSIFTRDAKISDISISNNDEFSFSIQYIVTPKVDISKLELTFKYYDDNNTLLTTKIKEVGNVSENVEYTITISLSEFTLSQIFTISYGKITVSSGTVSYI